ncbi:MAG: hypothetical protein ACSHWW_08395 [Nonlabens sp.]|uniref:hypothetical protein n=1 Tax=Nonlabens sp. TaxID=1888209 RepID=UPI003EF612D9
MISNLRIKVQLKSELQMAILELKDHFHADQLVPILDLMNNYDFDQYKEQLTKEILHNLKTVWTNPKSGVNTNQKLDAILFEHFIPQTKDTEALAYGIINWDIKDIDGVEVDLGFEYGFADGLEQAAGITLSYLNPYVENATAMDLDEYHLADCFKMKGLIAVHEVLAELEDKGHLKALYRNKEFCFLVGEHSAACHLVYSLSH